MKKLVLIIAAAAAAGLLFYLSGIDYPPANDHVQGSIGGRRLAHGATVCVSKLQNMSGKDLAMDAVADELAAQLSRAGFKGVVGEKQECQGSVYGEIITLKGKDRMEAEVEFRLMISGDDKPYISSIAKGKAEAAKVEGVPTTPLANSLAKPKAPFESDISAVARQAVSAAFADLARQIEAQRASSPTRAALRY